jgi:L-histidine Nalpha-methyltransferase
MSAPLTVDVKFTGTERRALLEADVRDGLGKLPRTLRPTWFYDERGSRLFDDITRLPEYYLTRAEEAILSEHAVDIVAASNADTLVELGSGTSTKTHLLLEAMAKAGVLRRIDLLDVSEEVMREAAEELRSWYGVEVNAVVGDFTRHLDALPRRGRRLWVFLGSTIGNFAPGERKRLLFDLEVNMGSGDHLLLGTDLIKAEERLLAAYDDAAGVTAEFNRNVLLVLNSELGATFDPAAFEHVAVWDPEQNWVEMRLRATRPQEVAISVLPELGRLRFEAGEEIRTEISAKFDPGRLRDELAAAGLVQHSAWLDPAGDFQLTLARPYC